jgi:hypothetical protein
MCMRRPNQKMTDKEKRIECIAYMAMLGLWIIVWIVGSIVLLW